MKRNTLLNIQARKIIIVSTFLCLGFYSETIFAQAGILDQSFGSGGQFVYALNNFNDYGNSIALQSDGKILFAGSSWNGNDYDFSLIRVNANGTIDTTFGDRGKVITAIGKHADFAYSIAIQADEKILVAGSSDLSNSGFPSKFDFAVVRYKVNGSLDNTFGNAGKMVIDFGNDHDFAYTIKVQRDGKIIIGGRTTPATYTYFAVAKLNINGSLDSSFGSNGKVTISDIFVQDNSFTTMSLQNDGKIIIGGTGGNLLSTSFEFALVRFNNNGILDSSFGVNGKVVSDFMNGDDKCFSITFQNDGKIIAVGDAVNKDNYNQYVAAARYKTNGELDSSFGTNGKVVTNILVGINAENQSVLIQPDNKILIGGTVDHFGFSNNLFNILRLNPNGSFDVNFGTNGYTSNQIGSGDARAVCIALQSDGGILLAGSGQNYSNFNYNFAIARYTNADILPITLSSFTAIKKQSSVLLNWQTTNENGNNFFSIERSINDSRSFNQIGVRKNNLNGNPVQHYNYEDLVPLNGINYYRIKQTDLDGSNTYSRTVAVDFSKIYTIKLYPNPVKDRLVLEGLNAAGSTTISIINLSGIVLAKTTVADNSFSWNIKQLPAGNYYLRIEENKNITTLKFIKE